MSNGPGRNDRCSCGSGMKYKKCCASVNRPRQREPIPINRTDVLPSAPASGEHHLHFVPSVVIKGQRCRAVFNKICFRPENETFHEFLTTMAIWTLGRDWVRTQMSMPAPHRHLVGKWMQDFADFRKAPRDHKIDLFDGREVHSAIAPSSVSNLLQLGYDFFCLQAIDRLPDFLIARVKKSLTFPAARYELAVAAIMARAGFAIAYLDDSGSPDKRCEFIATHRADGYQVGVEAKCRLRDACVDPANYSYDEDYKGIANLIRKAKKQAPSGMPFVIFIDVNLPPSAGYSPRERPWLPNVDRALGKGDRSPDTPDPFSMLVATNYGHLFGSIDDFGGRGEWGAIVPQYPIVPFPDQSVVATILDAVGRYSTIPREV